MEQCSRCGASMAAEAQWCGQCYAMRTPAATSTSLFAAAPQAVSASLARPAPVGMPQPGARLVAQPSTVAAGVPGRAVPVKTEGPVLVRTRWGKTPTTFGPVGRVLCTLGLVLGLAFFVAGGVITGGMTLVGAGIWGFVIMPWALRDLWRAGTVPPTSAGR